MCSSDLFADPLSQTSRPVPDALRAMLTGFEAGQTMLQLKTGDWAALGRDASAVRESVFIQEQGAPAEMVWDDADQHALHIVAYNGLAQPVATARLLPSDKGTSKLGRMAVVRVLRGAHVGQTVLQALTDAARKRGDTQLLLHAQRSAERFYQRAGFTAVGEPFAEVNIPHIKMLKHL